MGGGPQGLWGLSDPALNQAALSTGGPRWKGVSWDSWGAAFTPGSLFGSSQPWGARDLPCQPASPYGTPIIALLQTQVLGLPPSMCCHPGKMGLLALERLPRGDGWLMTPTRSLGPGVVSLLLQWSNWGGGAGQGMRTEERNKNVDTRGPRGSLSLRPFLTPTLQHPA